MVRHWRRIPPELQFPARFLALVAAMYALGSYIEPLRSAITRLVMLGVPTASSAFGVTGETSVDGVSSFAGGQFEYVVTYECASVSAIVILVAAIVSHPSTTRHPIAPRQRLWASAVGVVGLMMLNYLRLGALAWIGLNAPDRFDAAHIYWFQGLTFLAVGLGWLAWVRLVVRRGVGARPADRLTTYLRRIGTRFMGTFSALTVVGLVFGLDRLYAQLIGLVASVISPFVWGADALQPEVSAEQSAYFFGAVVALLALMIATPHVTRMESLWGFVRVAPLLALGQVTALVAQVGAGADLGWGAVEGLLVLPMAIVITPLPLAIWFAWIERYARMRTRAGRAPSWAATSEVAHARRFDTTRTRMC